MPDAQAFPADQFAFPADQGGEDDAEASAQRNEQIQQSFDAQRFQRGMAQSFSKALSNQAAEISRLRQQKGAS